MVGQRTKRGNRDGRCKQLPTPLPWSRQKDHSCICPWRDRQHRDGPCTAQVGQRQAGPGHRLLRNLQPWLRQATHGLSPARDRTIAFVSRPTRTWCALLGSQRPTQLLGKGWKVSHLSAPSLLFGGRTQPPETGARASSCRRALLPLLRCSGLSLRLQQRSGGLERLRLANHACQSVGLLPSGPAWRVLCLLRL